MSNAERPSGPQSPPRSHLSILAWCLVILVFVYFACTFLLRPPQAERDQMASFVQALRVISEDYVDEVDREQLYRGAMQGMVASLGDRYSAYLTPGQMGYLNEETEGEYGGIGIVFFAGNGRAVVEEVLKDGPAARAGMQAGDMITHVGGEGIANLAADQVSSMIRGEVGTPVELTLLRPASEETLTLSVTREKITVPNVEHEMLGGGIGLLRIATFDQDCAQEAREALERLQEDDLKGLIVDVRRNAGGLVNQATAMCDLFIEEGLLLAHKGRGEEEIERVLATPATALPLDVPVVVLVDRGTASAAEILAGVLQAHGRATVVGTGTVGKGSVNAVVRLRDQSGLLLTVSRFELEGGKVIAGAGITPDVEVGQIPPRPEGLDPEQARAWYIEQRDKADEAQLQEALELIGQKLAEQ